MMSAFSPEEIDQLQRAAQMFEMILDSGAQSDEAYETLKDVYTKLRMPEEYKRVTARFAEFLLSCDNRDAGLAQLTELAEHYPEEAEWRRRLVELDAPPPASDGLNPEQPPAPLGLEREDIAAFNRLKTAAEQQAVHVLRESADEDLEHAISEAEKLLADFDPSFAGPIPSDAPTEVPGQPAPGPTPAMAATASPGGKAAGERASARHVEAHPHGRGAADVEREMQRSLRLGEMLVEQGVITRENLDTALAKQKTSNKRIGDILVELGYATETDVLHCLQVQAGVPYLPLELYDVQPEVAALLPAAFARKHRLVVVDLIANNVLVAIASPLSRETKAELETLLDDRRLSYYISAQSEVDKKIEELYPRR